MAEETSGVTHPGSWVGDSIEEFKKAPPAAKIAIVVAIVAAAGIGYYEYSKSKSNTSGISGASTPSTDLQGAQGFPTVPGGNTGTVPVLPGGLQPIYDPNGNLVGFQPAPTGTNTPPGGTTPPGPTGPPTPTPTPKPKPKGKPDNDKGGEGTDKGKLPSTTHTVTSKAHTVSGPGVKSPTGTQKGHKPGPQAPERKTPPHPSTRKVFKAPPGPTPTPTPSAPRPQPPLFRSPPPTPVGNRGNNPASGGRAPG